MSPFERMEAQYAKTPQERTFEYYISWHLLYGFVFSTPDFFVMGRPIRRAEGPISEDGELLVAPRWEADCWYCHAMAGDMRKAWSILPYPLGWLAFERVRAGVRELTFLPLEEIKRLQHEPEKAT